MFDTIQVLRSAAVGNMPSTVQALSVVPEDLWAWASQRDWTEFRNFSAALLQAW
jgi:hypothetical protein